MVITATDRHMHAPRISIAAFVGELTAHNFANATIAAACYTKVFSEAVDPLFALAIFWHESNFATNPQSINVRYANHNPGNLRNPPPAAPTIQTDRGSFLTFADWVSGFEAMAVHLASPIYRDLTIGEVFAKWAPASDGNDPARYTAGVLDYMNQHADIGGTPAMPVPYDRVHTSADIGPSRTLDSIRWFILHDTEGYFAGDEAVLTSAAAPVESANFLIGREPGQCVYVVPITETAWAAGNDQVGEQAVQVEMSGFAGNGQGYTDYQYAKLAEIYRWCVGQGMVNVPPVYLGLHPADTDGGPEPDDAGCLGHAGVPNPNGLGASPAWGGIGGHVDPGPEFDWPRFIGLISGNAPPPPPQRTIDGIAVGEGVWQLYSSVGEATAARTRIFGVLTGPEHDEWLTTADGTVLPVVVARFERLPVLWDRGATPAPFDVRVPGPGDKLTKAKPKLSGPHSP